jgi:phosphoserine phosphatase RsbU/P
MAMPATVRAEEVSLMIETAGQRRMLPVTKSPFTIGRSDQCDAVIPDFRVSRTHAKVLQEGGTYFLVDAGSRHGTFVNALRCDRVALKPNDEITLGVPGIRIVFNVGTAATHITSKFLTRFASDTEVSDLEKLRLFLQAARSLSGGLVVNEVLRNMLEYALRLTKAERGFIYLKQPVGRGITLACGLDSNGTHLTEATKVSHSVVEDAMTTAAEFITGDAMEQSALAARASIMAHELRTVVAIPLRARSSAGAPNDADVVGVLYLDSRLASRNLTGIGPEVLRALAGECAAVLESARLMEAEQAARYYRQELDIAANIQRSLICESEVVSEFVRVTGRSIPCKDVGGDFYDVHVTPDKVTAIVADVSGKGISAALLASVIHGMFIAQISAGTGLVDCVTAINTFLCSRVAGQKYATAMAVQARKDGTLEMVNCGHVPALLAADGKISVLSDGNLPLGLMADATFESTECQFPAHARLCMLTDGISETENAQDYEFGLDGVAQHLHSPEPIAEILNAVHSFAEGREAQDDRTLVLIQRTA